MKGLNRAPSDHRHHRTGSLWIVLLLLAVVQTACTSWYSIPVARSSLENEQLVGKTIRVGTPTGVTELVVQRLDFPRLEGHCEGMFLAIDLNSVSSLQVEGFDAGKTAGGLFGSVAAVFITAVLVISVALVATWN